jgi:hypothetical protein
MEKGVTFGGSSPRAENEGTSDWKTPSEELPHVLNGLAVETSNT